MQVFLNKIKALQGFANDKAYEVVGEEAVSHFRESFRNQGFTNTSLSKWKDVQRRTNPRDKSKASATRPILTGATGDLGNSITYKKQPPAVLITSDKVYAEVHNTGGRAGRGKGFRMPKRQFIGPSKKLTARLNKAMEQHMNKITK